MAVAEKKAQKTPKKKKGERTEKRIPVQGKSLRIKLVRSLIGFPRYQREVVKGLGLRRVNSEVMRKECPEIWGMVKKIPHLLKVEVIEE